jgi:hypothetical protein
MPTPIVSASIAPALDAVRTGRDAKQENPSCGHAPGDRGFLHARHNRVDASSYDVRVDRDHREAIKLGLGVGDVLAMLLLGSGHGRIKKSLDLELRNKSKAAWVKADLTMVSEKHDLVQNIKRCMPKAA